MEGHRVDRARLAADALARARRGGGLLVALPPGGRPDDLSTALAIQRARVRPAIGGWKCGLPAAGRVVVAPIDRRAIVAAPGPVCVTMADMRYEAELAFTLAHPLEPRDGGHDRASVLAAVAEVRLALELVHGRFRDPDAIGFLDMLADDLFNEGVVLGRVVDFADVAGVTEITIEDDGGSRSFPAVHPAGDPLAPLVWLADHLAELGTPLQRGMVVITGALAPIQAVRASGSVRVGFGGIGTVPVTFEFEGGAG